MAAASASARAVAASSADPSSAPPPRKPWKLLIPAAVVLLVLAIPGGLYFRSRHPVFDGTLKQALAVQLEQSPYLNIFPESRIQQALKFMGRSAEERVTRDVAHEICLRESVKAMLTGSISSLGSHYVITLEAVNAQTNDSLGREQVEAESKEQVLKSLDRAASSLRGKLGESIGSVQKFATPLEAATTSSLDALKEFSLGQAAHSRFDDDAALPHLKRAVELDPNFAMAWAVLGVAYYNETDTQHAAECIQKAFDLKDRASEREKFYISGHYYDTFKQQAEQSAQLLEQWKQTYPRDSVPRDNLSLLYATLGQHEKSLANASEALQLDAKDPYAYQNLSSAYQYLNRYDESNAVAEQAIAQKAEAWSVHLTLLGNDFIRGDESAMQREVEHSAGRPEEPVILLLRSNSRCALGKINEAREAYARALSAAQARGYREFGASILASEAACDAETGFLPEARQQVNAALAQSDNPDSRAAAAYLFARLGDAARAQKLIDDLAKESPSNTVLNQAILPAARAILSLQHNQAAQAIAQTESAIPYELGAGPRAAGYLPNYIRGEAFLRAHDGAKAAAEYQKILDHRGVDPTSVLYSLAHLGLGRAYALQGDTVKAKGAYQDFFAAWKDADADIPVLKTAKAEYEKLK